MKNHLKRISAPKTWKINRQENTFVIRPTASGHQLGSGLPLGVILRDFLKLVNTTSEVKKLLNRSAVLVDGTRVKDYRQQVGMFDLLRVEKINKTYRVVFDQKGRINLREVEANSTLKPRKIIGKTLLPGGKVQYNLYDGRNLIADLKAQVGDSLLMDVAKGEVKEVLPLAKGAAVFLIHGKHSGSVGTLKEVKGKEAVYIQEGKEVGTLKEYLFVVGKHKPMIEVSLE